MSTQLDPTQVFHLLNGRPQDFHLKLQAPKGATCPVENGVSDPARVAEIQDRGYLLVTLFWLHLAPFQGFKETAFPGRRSFDGSDSLPLEPS